MTYLIDGASLILCYQNKPASSQLAFSMDKVLLEDKIHVQTLSVRGHGNISVVPTNAGKNWKLGTLKIIWRSFDTKGCESLLMNYNILHHQHSDDTTVLLYVVNV